MNKDSKENKGTYGDTIDLSPMIQTPMPYTVDKKDYKPLSDGVLKIIKAMDKETSNTELLGECIIVNDAEGYGSTHIKFGSKAEAAQALADFENLIDGVEVGDE